MELCGHGDSNGEGQLGDGSTTAEKSTPVRVQQAGITWKAVVSWERVSQ